VCRAVERLRMVRIGLLSYVSLDERGEELDVGVVKSPFERYYVYRVITLVIRLSFKSLLRFRWGRGITLSRLLMLSSRGSKSVMGQEEHFSG